jgi:tetratricopeptide (TPR) repeat protein
MNQFQHNHTSDLSASLSCNSSISTSDVDAADIVGLEIGSEVQTLVQRLLRREEFQTVISVASELMKDHPESLFLHFALGTAYSNLGQALETIHHCQRFIDIEGDETIENFKSNNLPSIKNNLGLALKDLGLLERAEEVFTSLLSQEKDFVPALINYGNLLNDGARLSEAQTQFVKAIEVNPDNALVYWNLHSLSQDRDTARSILELCLSKDPANELANITLAGLLAFEGNSSHLRQLADNGYRDNPLVRSIEWIMSLPELPQIHFNRWALFDAAVARADRNRPMYEFGVWMGNSFRYLIDSFPAGFGFDTFEGLPENWHGLPPGTYSSFGQVPNILGADFITGEFRDTLPGFFGEARPMAGLINFDADLYSSTMTALTHAAPVIDDRTVLIFDELIVNRNWEQDEFRALREFCEANKLSCEVFAVSLFTKQAACLLRKSAG